MNKNYKEKTIDLGRSDIATLILKSPCNIGEVHTGSDGSYKGYLVDETIEIPDYYKKVYEADTWLKVYDDEAMVFEARAKKINVYNAGKSCIIQFIGDYTIERTICSSVDNDGVEYFYFNYHTCR